MRNFINLKRYYRDCIKKDKRHTVYCMITRRLMHRDQMRERIASLAKANYHNKCLCIYWIQRSSLMPYFLSFCHSASSTWCIMRYTVYPCLVSGTRTHCNTLKQQPRGCLLARFTGAPRQGIHNTVLRRARNEHARRSRYAIVHLTASGVKYSNRILLMY